MAKDKVGRQTPKSSELPKKEKTRKQKARMAFFISLAVFVVSVCALGGWLVYESTLGAIDRIDEGKIEYVDPEDQDQFDEPDSNTGSSGGTTDGNTGTGSSTEVTIDWPKISTIKSDGVIKILLLGADVWEDGSRGRSDVIMLATLNEKTGDLSLISFQRDTYVQIPGYKDNRINAAYAFGGTKLLKEVLKLNFGITVDGVVVIDFTHFEQLIDALGGVDIELTQKEADHLNEQGATLTAGVNHLNGRWALAYSRIRKIDSDFGRTSRQRTVMNAIFQSYKGISVSEIPGMLSTVLPMVSTDMSDGELIKYATKVLAAGADTIHGRSIPFTGAYKSQTIRKMMVLVPDLEKCHEALKQYIYGKDY